MSEISIIVPVYNVEKYLHKCVDSILAQTFTDYELILVDDESPDHSGAICDDYAKQDERIRVIHKKNGGLSDARNAGIDIATSPYIGFVDSDDYIKPDMFEQLYHDITKESADLALCGIYDLYPGKTPRVKQGNYEVANRQRATEIIFQGNIFSVHAYNKLYRREIFATLRYPYGKYHEDSYIILDVLANCNKVVFNPLQKYYYLHREDSINTERFSDKQFDYIDAWQRNEARLADSTPELRHVAHQRVCFANFLVLDKILRSNAESSVPHTKDIVHYLRRNAKFIMTDPTFTTPRKVALLGLMINLKIYKLITRVKH